jgi:putative ABC transport system permease protein
LQAPRIRVVADADGACPSDAPGVSFFTLVFRNLVRHRTRSLLTVLGIGIGITTVVALGAITSGFKASAQELAHIGGADFMVAQKGAADMTFSTLPEDDLAVVQGVEGVGRAWGALFVVSRVGANPFFMTWGIEHDALAAMGLDVTRGRLPVTSSEILLGQDAARSLGVALGDVVEVEGRSFTVAGVHETDARFEASGAYALLAGVQAAVRKPGLLTAIYVVVEGGAAVDEVMQRVTASSTRFAAISTADEYSQVDQGIELLDAANLAISLLAIVIGAIGVMNTMIMSVFERTREIGILRAVGWRSSRVVRLVIGESLTLCVVAAAVGILFGIGATRLVTLVPAIGSVLEPAYPPDLFVRGAVIAIGVALVGALYPAIRAVRLSPMEALRHE